MQLRAILLREEKWKDNGFKVALISAVVMVGAKWYQQVKNKDN